MTDNVIPIRIPDGTISRAQVNPLPFGIADTHGYVADVNVHIAALHRLVVGIPAQLDWHVLEVARFTELAISVDRPEQAHGLFWQDQRNQAGAFCAMVLWRAEALLTTAVRGLATGELLGPAVLSRSLLELASHAVVTLRDVIGTLAPVAREPKVFAVGNDVTSRLEGVLLKAIWGTRLGSSDLGDKHKTPLWEQSLYLGESAAAGNPIGHLQKMAKLAPDVAVDAFKVYEFLCDLVHPSTQGFRLFWESADEIQPGHTRYTLGKGSKQFDSVAISMTLWAIGYSCVMLRNVIAAANDTLGRLDVRLEQTYGIPAEVERS